MGILICWAKESVQRNAAFPQSFGNPNLTWEKGGNSQCGGIVTLSLIGELWRGIGCILS